MRVQALSFAFLLFFVVPVGGRGEEGNPGQVQLPLETYLQLLQASQDPSRAPAGYALGSARVEVNVSDDPYKVGATVQVQLDIRVLEDEWSLIPVLPAGTPVETATVGGEPIQLLATPQGLMWSTKTSGSYTMSLTYRLDAIRSDAGFSLPIPVPQAAATRLTAVLPGRGLDVAVIPAAGVRRTETGDTTQVTATIPTTTGVHLSWRSPVARGHVMSRAAYRGRLLGDAVLWRGVLDVELFGDETVTVPLLPRTVALSDLQVDGKKASILSEADRFAAVLRGRGVHQVLIDFQVPLIRDDGPPRVKVAIPEVPVSQFELTLPGKKELSVTPAAAVQSKVQGKSTVATVHVPLTNEVTFTWSEAVPEEAETEVRSNAAIFHTLYAEEGVLYGRATVQYEVNRGETHVIELGVPEAVQVNRVESVSANVADWRISASEGSRSRKLTVFFDHPLKGEIVFSVDYDRSLATGEGIDVPLFHALDAQRQKGMLALLASRDQSLSPVEEPDAARWTRIGENQLPPFVREAIDRTIAHTFKYVEPPPSLAVQATTPDPAVGRFDAQVDTLFTLGDVTIAGSASVEIQVKSGGLTAFDLTLPAGVNLLSLTAPSLRSYDVSTEDGRQRVAVELTQEMQGDFRIELAYERILTDDGSELEVPTLAVRGAEVEQGRIAVEARSAVEVQPTAVTELSPIDVEELPRQVVLRTTNPILLAYKYVHAETPPRLALTITRHRVLETRQATIDRADYRTLFTRDGLFVTTARLTLRNSRKQFLRVGLPEGSDVWSVLVDGKPEHPASSDEGGPDSSVLVKIPNATQGFPVEIIYATPGTRIHWLGKLRASLPRLDILVTQSRWDVYLPSDMRYGSPSSNMELVQRGGHVTADEMAKEMAVLDTPDRPKEAMAPLLITVPTSGIHFAFEKLYANQSDQDVWFSVAYASASGARFGQAANLLGIVLFWLGIWLRTRNKRHAPAVSSVGLLILVVTIGVLHASAVLPLLVSVCIVAAWLLHRTRGYLHPPLAGTERTE